MYVRHLNYLIYLVTFHQHSHLQGPPKKPSENLENKTFRQILKSSVQFFRTITGT